MCELKVAVIGADNESKEILGLLKGQSEANLHCR